MKGKLEKRADITTLDFRILDHLTHVELLEYHTFLFWFWWVFFVCLFVCLTQRNQTCFFYLLIYFPSALLFVQDCVNPKKCLKIWMFSSVSMNSTVQHSVFRLFRPQSPYRFTCTWTCYYLFSFQIISGSLTVSLTLNFFRST